MSPGDRSGVVQDCTWSCRIFQGTADALGASPQGQKRAEQAAAKKDLPRLEELLAGERVAKSAAKAFEKRRNSPGRKRSWSVVACLRPAIRL